MGSINLYRIDSAKVRLCLQDLIEGGLKVIKIKTIQKDNCGTVHDFRITLYLENPYQSDEGISWNWILNEFQQETFNVYKAPKAVLLIEETVDNNDTTYAVTFGNSYFKIDKFCDRDFGFCFASRMEYKNVKTTTLTAPNLTRSKTVNTYINYNELDFNSGESFSKLKVSADLEENFTLFKPTLEIGNSIRFNIGNESVDGILDVVLYVERILQIPDEKTKYKIPLFQPVKDDDMLQELNQKIEKVLVDVLINRQPVSLFVIPELEIIGANEIFNHTDDEFELKYPRANARKISVLTIQEVSQFCTDNAINTIDKIDKIKIARCRDGEVVVTLSLRNIIEYTDDENKCVFSGGKWYVFNQDYLTYLNDSIKEIESFYYPEYDFNDTIHNSFIDSKYEAEKGDAKYAGKENAEIKKALKQKYYAERCFNLLREQESLFTNYDRVGTSAGFEKMDLYEKATETMFAVKKGNASSDFCYAVDQSLTALKKLKHGEISDMPLIKNVGLWLILERAEHLPTTEQNKVDLCSLDMLMLKNRIDQWKKEVRLAGYKPIIYINYRS